MAKTAKTSRKPEIIRYNNGLNSIDYGVYSAAELNILMTLCAKLKPEETQLGDISVMDAYRREPKEITITYKQFREIMELPTRDCNDEEFQQRLDEMGHKILTLTHTVQEGAKRITFVFFTTFTADGENQTLTVEAHRQFTHMLADATNQFTRFELNDFLGLRSKYTKILFCDMKQWKSTGRLVYDNVPELLRHYGLSESYPARNIVPKILQPAVNELTKRGIFSDVVITPKKQGRANVITGYEILFEKSGESNGQQEE